MEVNVKFLTKTMPEDVGGEAGKVLFTLGNGSKLSIGLAELAPEVVTRLALHGLSQKVGDAASGFSKDRDFLGAFGSMSQVADNLRAGMWASRSGGGNTDLATALAKLRGITPEEAKAALDKATEEQIAGLKKHPRVKEEIAKIQAARAKEAAKGAGKLDDLLSELGLE